MVSTTVISASRSRGFTSSTSRARRIHGLLVASEVEADSEVSEAIELLSNQLEVFLCVYRPTEGPVIDHGVDQDRPKSILQIVEIRRYVFPLVRRLCLGPGNLKGLRGKHLGI